MQKRTVRPEFGQDLGLIHEVVVTGRRVGAGPGFWRFLADSPQLFARCHRFIVDGQTIPTLEPTVVQDVFFSAYDTPDFGNDFQVLNRLALRVASTSKKEVFWKHLVGDQLKFRQLVRYVRSQVVDSLTASEIMGENYFHPIDDVEKITGQKFAPYDRSFLFTIPFTTRVLRAACQTHLLVPGIRLRVPDIARIGAANSSPEHFNLMHDHWAEKETVPVRWYLIRKTFQPRTNGLTFDRQLGLLGDDEDVPTIPVLYLSAKLFQVRTGQYLFFQKSARCLAWGSRLNPGPIVWIEGQDWKGNFAYDINMEELYVDGKLLDRSGPGVGLASEILP